MITIGITGGIGSGKSTVCRMLEARGARVFYADVEARRIMERHVHVRRGLMRLLGDDIYADDGSLDRRLVSSRMFGDAERVHAVNRLVHPRVRTAFARLKRRALTDGVSLLVYEAALLDPGSIHDLDAIVVVVASESNRISRVTGRDGSPTEAVVARMRYQRSEAEFRTMADHLIENDGTLDHLRDRVDALWSELLESPGAAS